MLPRHAEVIDNDKKLFMKFGASAQEHEVTGMILRNIGLKKIKFIVLILRDFNVHLRYTP